jgi:2-isopropylmalate synthase
MPKQDRLIIFDTTLRDGEQSPGCSMNLQEKLRIARALADLGVDVIEAGFPAASPGDFEAVSEVARQIKGPIICGLARCNAGDIDAVWKALEPAERKRIHVFVATSAIHMQYKLQMAKEEILKTAVEGVRRARSYCDDVEFSAEDAARTEWEFLKEIVSAVIAAGATTVNIPDTVGYTVPGEFAALIEYLRAEVPGIENIVLSVHCHDDLGMAVANSLAAVKAGARQIECTINGIGERAGNCSLEEVVMAAHTRSAFFELETGINTTRLFPTCRLVSSITGMPIPRNKAIVGGNAFAHEAGIHQHGVLQHAATYEIMRPEDVGVSENSLVLGKHSGRHAFRDRLNTLGFVLEEAELDNAFRKFKRLADQKKEIFDADLEAIVLQLDTAMAGPWVLRDMQIVTRFGGSASAELWLQNDQEDLVSEKAEGDGPIDAAFKAILAATGVEATLKDFEVRSLTVGQDAQGEVAVLLKTSGRDCRGTGVSTDIIEAGARALVDAVNRIVRTRDAGFVEHSRAAASV